MAKTIKRIDIKEFRNFGFLQEINRLFLHPMGMALEVDIHEETGEETLGGIWDYRSDPEGMLFGAGMIDIKKAKNVRLHSNNRHSTRIDLLGYIIQPEITERQTDG